MRALGSFVGSTEGKFYGLVCDRYGIDPGAPFRDEVVAYNVRAAYLAVGNDQPTDDAEAAAKAFEQEWLSLGG